jgi:hypothetical protein
VAGQHDDRRLEAALAQQLDCLAAIHVRQADIHDQQVDGRRAGAFHALCRRRFLQNRELVIERELLREGFAEVIVIIHQKNGACCHAAMSLAIWFPTPTPLSNVGKDQDTKLLSYMVLYDFNHCPGNCKNMRETWKKQGGDRLYNHRSLPLDLPRGRKAGLCSSSGQS